MCQTRQKLKEAYDLHFAATIERAEKQIILARHGRRLLNLLDDNPIVPGDTRPGFEHAHQARQILSDAEEDLREWHANLEPVRSTAGGLGTNLMPHANPHQHQHESASVSTVAPSVTEHEAASTLYEGEARGRGTAGEGGHLHSAVQQQQQHRLTDSPQPSSAYVPRGERVGGGDAEPEVQYSHGETGSSTAAY